MFQKKKRKTLPKTILTPVEQGLVYAAEDANKSEQRDIELAFARLFSSKEGQRVLTHLQMMTFQRALGPDSSNEQLRYTEGQRALMATILRLIARGRQST